MTECIVGMVKSTFSRSCVLSLLFASRKHVIKWIVTDALPAKKKKRSEMFGLVHKKELVTEAKHMREQLYFFT